VIGATLDHTSCWVAVLVVNQRCLRSWTGGRPRRLGLAKASCDGLCGVCYLLDTAWHFSYLDETAWFMGATMRAVLGGGDQLDDDQRQLHVHRLGSLQRTTAGNITWQRLV
jgi:hypothetical protein